jgi:hypothetical protein
MRKQIVGKQKPEHGSRRELKSNVKPVFLSQMFTLGAFLAVLKGINQMVFVSVVTHYLRLRGPKGRLASARRPEAPSSASAFGSTAESGMNEKRCCAKE